MSQDRPAARHLADFLRKLRWSTAPSVLLQYLCLTQGNYQGSMPRTSPARRGLTFLNLRSSDLQLDLSVGLQSSSTASSSMYVLQALRSGRRCYICFCRAAPLYISALTSLPASALRFDTSSRMACLRCALVGSCGLVLVLMLVWVHAHAVGACSCLCGLMLVWAPWADCMICSPHLKLLIPWLMSIALLL